MSNMLEQLTEAGIELSVLEDGNLDIVGDPDVVDSWLPTIRENKSTLIAELRGPRVLQMLAAEPERKYALVVHDASTDPVLVTVGIRGLATFDLEIPRAHYDGMALIEVLEQHCAAAMEKKAA